MERATINITTFRGSFGSKHWYGELQYFDNSGNFETIELLRPVKQSEIDAFPDRFLHYEEGCMVNAFNRWQQVIIRGKEIFDTLGLKCVLKVDGVPNNDTLTYDQAIDPNLDVRSKCCSCGKVFSMGEGCYNTPRGKFCVNCY